MKKHYLILIIVASLLITIIVLVAWNGKNSMIKFENKLAEKQKQIDAYELSNKDLFLKNAILFDSFNKLKPAYDSLQKILKNRPYAKNPNTVNSLPIDSTVSYLSGWLSEKN